MKWFCCSFLEQCKTHRGGEGAGRVGMEWEDRKLIFTQTGKKNCLGLWDKIWKQQTNTFMVCGVGSTLIGVKNSLIHTQIVHLKGIPGNSNFPTNNPVFLGVSLHPCRREAAHKFFLTEVYTIQGLSKLTMKYISKEFVMLPLVFPWNDILGTSGEICYWWCVTTQISVVQCTSDCLCHEGNLLQLIRSTTQIWEVA